MWKKGSIDMMAVERADESPKKGRLGRRLSASANQVAVLRIVDFSGHVKIFFLSQICHPSSGSESVRGARLGKRL